MSAIRTFTATKYAPDHFEPQDDDPHVQRKTRGFLEQIDYAAFASNKAVLANAVGELTSERLQKLAIAAATARARWVTEALAAAEAGATPAVGQAARLGELRVAFLELSEAYEALRRMVERGYVAYRPAGA